MATAQQVIDRTRQLINDVASNFVSGLRWSDTEMLRWLTDGQREIVTLKPEANPITDAFTVTGGSPRQRLDPTLAYRLIRVEANGSSAAAETAADVLYVTSTGSVVGATLSAIETWTLLSTAPGGLYGVAVDDSGRIVVVGDNAGASYAAYSDDGLTWSAAGALWGAQQARSVTFGADKFVAIGDQEPAYARKGAWSTDGITWTDISASLVTQISGGSLVDVFFANNVFALMDDFGEIYTSPDGTTWTERLDQHGERHSGQINYGNGRWIVFSVGELMYSDNGTSWTTVASPIITSLPGEVAFGAGLWVAVGTDDDSTPTAMIFTSATGIDDWTQRTIPAGLGNVTNLRLTAVVWTGARFIAVGHDVTGSDENFVITSTDGTTWTIAAQDFGVSGEVIGLIVRNPE